MIQRKDKVTHPIHGNGIVENLSNNESIAMVDFKGVMTKCEVSNLQKGVNEFKQKNETISIECLKTKIAMIRGEYCSGAGLSSEGGRIALDKLEQLILNK